MNSFELHHFMINVLGGAYKPTTTLQTDYHFMTNIIGGAYKLTSCTACSGVTAEVCIHNRSDNTAGTAHQTV